MHFALLLFALKMSSSAKYSCALLWTGQEDQDWGIVAMVLDRMFLWVFGAAAVIGSTMILTESPSLFESTDPIDAMITTIGMDRLDSPRETAS